MSFNSKVLYTGDGATTEYNIPFGFIAQTHVQVWVNLVQQSTPMHYSISGATVIMEDPVPLDDAIEIRRVTSPGAILVDFQDGSVLNEGDLDLAYLHNFYLTQEATDSYNQLVNESMIDVATDVGIVEEETDDIINALVAEMLSTDAAATLQARISDIDTNAESIISLGTGIQIQINTLAQGTAAEVYVQAGEPVPGVGGIPDPISEGARWYDSDDNNHPYIYLSSAWVEIEDPRIGDAVADITVLQADVITNAAAVVTESVARADADSATASTLALIGAENGAQTAFIVDTSTVKIDSDGGDTFAARFSGLATADSDNSAAISTEESARIAADGVLEVKYGVTLDVNGYITGFAQHNDGQTGSFVVMADEFAVVDPTTTWQASTAYALNDYVNPTSPTAGVVYKCTTPGTSAGSEPTWNDTPPATTADNSVVWTAQAGISTVVPFAISDGIVTMQNVLIPGSLTVDGTITASALEADLVLANLIRTANTGLRVELEEDSAGHFPFWIGSGTKGTVSGSPGAGARVFYDTDGDLFEITGNLKAETFSASAFTPISEVDGVDNGAVLSDYDPVRVGVSLAPINIRGWGARYATGQALDYQTATKELQGPTYTDTGSNDGFRAASRFTTMLFDMSFTVEGDVTLQLLFRNWDEGTTSWGAWQIATSAHAFASHGVGVPYTIGMVDSFQPGAAGLRQQYRWEVAQDTGDTGLVHHYWGHWTLFNLAETP